MAPPPDEQFPLEINGPDDLDDDQVWPGVVQQPTTLVAFWPDDQAPTQTEIFAALSQYLDVPQLVVHEPDDMEDLVDENEGDDVQWMGIVDLPPRDGDNVRPVECIVWAEPSMPVPEGEFGIPEAENASWIVGFEFMLDADDPLSSYIDMMQMVAGSLGQAPAVLDANCTVCHPRETLDAVFLNGETEPGSNCLWTIHVVSSGKPGEDPNNQSYWLHTHGLDRCRLPELEMLELDGNYVPAAAELFDGIIDLLLETGMPEPGEEFAIGQDLALVFQPWQVVAPTVSDNHPGGMQDREDLGEGSHAGAVVCGVRQEGQFAKLWVWPREVLDRLNRDEAAIYKTRRATDRQARLARALWDELAMGFASLHKLLPDERINTDDIDGAQPEEIRFLAKAGFKENGVGDPESENNESDGDPGREHLWFEIVRFDGDRLEGYLINTPLNVVGMNRHDLVWITRDQLSDWLVVTPLGMFDPSNAQMMWRAIDEIRQTADGLADAEDKPNA